MAFPINPPNSPLVEIVENGRLGTVTPPWYRFFASIQRILGDDIIQKIVAAPIVTFDITSSLDNERVLTEGAGIDLALSSTQLTVSLAPSGVTPNTYGAADQLAQLTVDQFGRITGAQQFTLNSTNVTEGTKLFFTNARARNALSAGSGLSYDSVNGIFSMTAATSVGSYTPTISSTSNLDSTPTVNAPFLWERIGSHVVGSGFLTVDPTAAGQVGFSMSVPVASNFLTTSDASGPVSSSSEVGFLFADTVSDLFRINFQASVTTAHSLMVQFRYIVQS